MNAEDFMDDGTPIRLAVTVDRTTRSALFDFDGTVSSPRPYTSVTRSIVYHKEYTSTVYWSSYKVYDRKCDSRESRGR